MSSLNFGGCLVLGAAIFGAFAAIQPDARSSPSQASLRWHFSTPPLLLTEEARRAGGGDLPDSPPDHQSDHAPERHGQQQTDGEAFGWPEIIPRVIGTMRIVGRNFGVDWVAKQWDEVWADLGAPRAPAVGRGVGVGAIWRRRAVSQNVRHQDVSPRGRQTFGALRLRIANWIMSHNGESLV
jgi:hypothetical protein